jgi:hypothetical protein
MTAKPETLGMKRRATAHAFETQGMVRGQEQAQRLRADLSSSHHSDIALRLSMVSTMLAGLYSHG